MGVDGKETPDKHAGVRQDDSWLYVRPAYEQHFALLLFVFLISSILHHHPALLHRHTLTLDRLLTFLVTFSVLVLKLFFSQTIFPIAVYYESVAIRSLDLGAQLIRLLTSLANTICESHLSIHVWHISGLSFAILSQ